MDAPNTNFQVELSNCEREPIHVPGAIQPFGLLLALSEALVIQQASDNCAAELGVPASALLGRSLFELLSPESAAQLKADWPAPEQSFHNPYPVSFTGGGENSWAACFHRHRGQLIAELEPHPPRGLSAEAFLREVQESLNLLYGAHTLQELCDHTAREVQRISGYDRVMIYRFDPEWNGRVVAAATSRPEIESYLGHHFPASDIPSQARQVFLSNWLRIIPDVDYRPAPLLPPLHPDSQRPLDLGQSLLRSVSPVHLQYLRNMNVGATMTISLLEDGKLWGIVACHHFGPRLLSRDLRAGCELLGQTTSSLLLNIEEREDQSYKQKLKVIHGALVEQMARNEDLVRGLVDFDINLLHLAGAGGAAAAIRLEGDWILLGRTPTRAQVDALAAWLVEQPFDDDIFFTDELSRLYPAARDYADVASGVMSICIPKTDRSFILWFRPEAAHTVTWAGNPNKNVERLADGSVRIEPRASFESWREVVRGKAAPWRKVEVESVRDLRSSILALDLRIQFVNEKKARAEAERVGREKADLVATVSHDLKNPLTAMDLTVALMEKKHGSKLPADILRAFARLRDLTRRMHRLIHDLLDISKIEGGNFQLERKSIEVNELLRLSVDLLQPLAHQGQINLTVDHGGLHCHAEVDEERILQVLSNLIGNALKFTPAGGSVTVGVESCRGDAVFFVRDTGKGIDPQHLSHVFDRFWQAKDTSRLGTGLGLAITKGIVDAHGGRIWVESQVGQGTTVRFTLPGAKLS